MSKIIGYEGIGPEEGTYIPQEEAFRYALERIQWDQEAQMEMVNWYYCDYTGNWLPVRKREL